MKNFDSHIIHQIQKWDQSQKKEIGNEEKIKIKLIISNHAQNNQFINLAENFTKSASRIIFKTKKSEKGEKNLPAFILKENIKYSALPLSKELAPFLDALSQINNNNKNQFTAPILKAVDKINIPVNLKLYIALECPHCPNVVKTLISLAMVCKNIHLHIIDGTLFPETAQKDIVMSAPCLILDDDFRLTGDVSAKEILTLIIERDTSQLSTATLKNILEQGNASWIANQMIEQKKIFNSFIKLLIHDLWSVRLGAMVIVEELVETDPELAAQLCPILIELFDTKDTPVKGDIFYVLGEAGTNETKKWIKNKLATLEHQDLIDAADDALIVLNSDN